MGLLTTIKSIFGLSSGSNRYLHCLDCKKKFVFDAGEQKFFKEKGFTDPKRCTHCRKRVKSRIRRRPRNAQNNHRHHRGRGRGNSIIDGHSPYADE